MTIPMNGGEQQPLFALDDEQREWTATELANVFPAAEVPEIFPAELANLIPDEPLWDCE